MTHNNRLQRTALRAAAEPKCKASPRMLSVRRPGVLSKTRLLAVITLCFVAVTYARDLAPIENQKIEYLIAAIEALPNAQFIRNGTSYVPTSRTSRM